jgi:hypothetical protein
MNYIENDMKIQGFLKEIVLFRKLKRCLFLQRDTYLFNRDSYFLKRNVLKRNMYTHLFGDAHLFGGDSYWIRCSTY